MTTVVISQPMFFPWVGLFEQIALADTYVHYDDVQYSKGSFTNRVQIWNGTEVGWMTVPVTQAGAGRLISEVGIDPRSSWPRKHLQTLRQSYKDAAFRDDMLDIVGAVYDKGFETIGELSMATIEAVCDYFGLSRDTLILRSSELDIAGSSSQRVFDLVRSLGGDRYVTGHGASKYLDHELFEREGIAVEYMDYRKLPYPQPGREFTPYISILDLIASCGVQGKRNICSETINWKSFNHGS